MDESGNISGKGEHSLNKFGWLRLAQQRKLNVSYIKILTVMLVRGLKITETHFNIIFHVTYY